MKKFRFNTICNIFQGQQALYTEIQYPSACGFIGKCAVIKYHQLMSTVKSIKGQSFYKQLPTLPPFKVPVHPIWELD